jgi:enterochelin esterase-like enzyme
MRQIFILAASLLIVGCQLNEGPQVSGGRLDSYESFESRYVTARTIRVWTPADYNADKQYDVLYMHDGQMLWDAQVAWNKQEWGVDEAMDSLIRMKKIRPTIVVGIDNSSERIGEYCPDNIVEYLDSISVVYQDIKPQGNDYLRFLVEEVKPFIDSVYSTYKDREHTWVMGSSCGGLISSYALCSYPEVFGGAACLSTHCTLAFPDPTKQDSAMMAAYRTYLKNYIPANSAKVYMDNGDQTLDANYIYAQGLINEMMNEEGWDSAHYMYRFFPGAAHCEDDWKVRLDIPLLFLLGQ